MAKDEKVLGFMAGVAKTSKSQNISNNEKNTIKEQKATASENKSNKNDISINISSKGVTITNLKRKKTKVNKTFYLENKYVEKMELLSRKTGISNSELIQLSLDFLIKNLKLEGFEEDNI